MTDILDEIAALKARENATILAHYYQEGEIQELADFTGDSLKLARAATKVQTDDHRLLRRPLHGRDGQDAQPGQARAAARPEGRLQPGGQLPRADKLARYQEMLRINGRRFQTVTYINSTRRGEGAVRLGRHLRQRRGDHPPRAGGLARSCSSRTATSASTSQR